MPKEEQDTPCTHQWDNWLKDNTQEKINISTGM